MIRILYITFLCVIVLFMAAGCAARATVTDTTGQVYEITSMRPLKRDKFRVVCGGNRIMVPFKSIVNMKIDPAQISPVDGRPHFGVEIEMRDGTVIGDITERGRCLICADNGFTGKNAKNALYEVQFSGVSSVRILGKERKQAQQDDDDDDDF